MFFASMMALGFAAGGSAHMFLTSPTPISGKNPKNPLDPSGSDFPCKLGTSLEGPLPTTGGQEMQAGSNQTLAFDLGNGGNTAVHGGGSCQISITYETDPAKMKDPKIWKVIYSIEGGCPSDALGNLQDGKVVECSGTETECVNSFPFTIPQGVKDGHAIMAWTWFNTIGNREMYMNCMNVQLSGGDGSEMDDFPDLFVANLAGVGSNQCTTEPMKNLKFPNPGKYTIQHTEGSPYELADPACGAAGGSGASPPPAAPSAYVSSQPTTPSAPASSAQPTSAPAPSSSPAASKPSSSPAAPKPSSSAAPKPSTPATTKPGSCPSGEVSCPEPGKLICIDSTHFGLCDIDFCAVSQSVAAGTQCKDGAITRKRKRGTLGMHNHKHNHGPNHGFGNAI